MCTFASCIAGPMGSQRDWPADFSEVNWVWIIAPGVAFQANFRARGEYLKSMERIIVEGKGITLAQGLLCNGYFLRV